jgi:trigger factor
MDISIKEIKDKSQVELTISVTSEELEPHLDRAAKSISKDHPIKGFRPGKATLDAAMNVYGKDRIVTEALEKGIPRWFVQAVLEHDIDALGRPATTITEADIEKGVTFTATVDVLPTITLGDPTKIVVERQPAVVNDKDVDQELLVLAKSRGTYIDVARPAQVGDTVIADFTVSMNGQEIEGGSSKNHPIQLGEGHFIPDFETKLQGIQAGDEREITMVFPTDFAQAELQGKAAQARVKAHEVKQRMVPEINDEFARKLGQFKDLQHLKDELKANMKEERVQKEKERLQGELTEKLADISTYGALPTSLLEREIDRRLQELMQMLAYQQKTLEEYLHQTKKTPLELRAELREPAERTIKVSLALRQFAKEQSIEASEEEVNEKALAVIQHYQEPDHDGHHHGEFDPEEVKDNVRATIRNQKALEKLEELATIKETAPAKA